MTRCIWIALAGLVLMTSVHAASFDCAKASSAVEKMICADAELSKLDEALDSRYKAALGNTDIIDTPLLIADQKQWLTQTRNACVDESCLKQAYASRLESLKPYSDKGFALLIRRGAINPSIGKGFPEDIEQIDGNLVFSRYDDNGNTRSIVDYDFTTGNSTFLAEAKTKPYLIAVGSRYVVVNDQSDYRFNLMLDRLTGPFVIEIIDRNAGGATRKKVLDTLASGGQIVGDRMLLLYSGSSRGGPQEATIFDLATLAVVKQMPLDAAVIRPFLPDKIVILNNNRQLVLYDTQLKELGRVALPAPQETINAYCGAGDLTQQGGHLIVTTDCGDIHIVNLKTLKVEHTIAASSYMPQFTYYCSLAVYGDLIFVTTEKQTGIRVFDVDTGNEVARLPIAATAVYTKGDVLLAADQSWSKPGTNGAGEKMRAFDINASALQSTLSAERESTPPQAVAAPTCSTMGLLPGDRYATVPATAVLPVQGGTAVQKDVPLAFTFPANYICKQITQGKRTVTVLGEYQDVTRIVDGTSMKLISSGVFDISVPFNVRFDLSTQKFSWENNPGLAEGMKSSGYSNVVLKRVDARGIPMYEMTAERAGEHTYYLYIASGDAGSTYQVRYTPPTAFTTHDQEVWEHFVNGFEN